MPLKQPPLPDEQIRILRAWIDGGAEWPQARPAPPRRASTGPGEARVRAAPAGETPGWVRNAVDAFILARGARGDRPSPEATGEP